MGAQAVVPVLCTAFVSGSPEKEVLKVVAALPDTLTESPEFARTMMRALLDYVSEKHSLAGGVADNEPLKAAVKAAIEAAADSGGDDDEEEDTTPVFPKELLPFLFHTLYDLNVISEEAFSEWVKADRMTPGWAECKAEADEWLKWLL